MENLIFKFSMEIFCTYCAYWGFLYHHQDVFFPPKNLGIWKAEKAKHQIWPVLLGSSFFFSTGWFGWKTLTLPNQSAWMFIPEEMGFSIFPSGSTTSVSRFFQTYPKKTQDGKPLKTLSQPWVLAFEGVQCLAVGIWNIKPRNFWLFTRARRRGLLQFDPGAEVQSHGDFVKKLWMLWKMGKVLFFLKRQNSEISLVRLFVRFEMMR